MDKQIQLIQNRMKTRGRDFIDTIINKATISTEKDHATLKSPNQKILELKEK